MSGLSMAPGVVAAPLKTYVTSSDVRKLLGCKDSKAYQVIREVNKCATEKGSSHMGAEKQISIFSLRSLGSQ
jgi:hypothetical protein